MELCNTMEQSQFPKDRKTEILRSLIREKLPQAIETNRAEADLCALSFQSAIKKERYVWISTYIDDKFEIDLEDWNLRDQRDNTVERKTLYSAEECLKIIQDWLC